MAKAKKLPSGRWRCLVYSGIDPSTKKRKYESFTADTRKEAEFLAAEFVISAKEKHDIKNMTVSEGIEKYIAVKTKVLSPSTIREYKRSAKNDLKILSDVKYKNLTNALIQEAVNLESEVHSTKTVQNMVHLLSASLNMFYPEFNLKVSYAQKKKKKRYIPTDDDIKKLIQATENTDIEVPILLAACGSLRRSEIAALTQDDVTNFGVNISKAMVQDENKQWVIKAPKSEAGYRFTPLSPEVIKKIRQCDDKITNLNPNQIYKRFKKALKECEIEDFRFHDLRHYYASVSHALGVPDKYIMQYGGWSSSGILKNVYQHVMSDKEEKEQEKVINFFDTLTSKEK